MNEQMIVTFCTLFGASFMIDISTWDRALACAEADMVPSTVPPYDYPPLHFLHPHMATLASAA
jgi:hypothetical protein